MTKRIYSAIIDRKPSGDYRLCHAKMACGHSRMYEVQRFPGIGTKAYCAKCSQTGGARLLRWAAKLATPSTPEGRGKG